MNMAQKELATMVRFLTSTLKEVKEFASKKTPGLIKDILEDAARRHKVWVGIQGALVLLLSLNSLAVLIFWRETYYSGVEKIPTEAFFTAGLCLIVAVAFCFSLTENILNLLEIKKNPKSYLLGVIQNFTDSGDE